MSRHNKLAKKCIGPKRSIQANLNCLAQRIISSGSWNRIRLLILECGPPPPPGCACSIEMIGVDARHTLGRRIVQVGVPEEEEVVRRALDQDFGSQFDILSSLKLRSLTTTLSSHRHLLQIRNLIRPLRDPTPPHNPRPIHAKRPRNLPATPTLRRPVPDSLLAAQLPNSIEAAGLRTWPKPATPSPQAL